MAEPLTFDDLPGDVLFEILSSLLALHVSRKFRFYAFRLTAFNWSLFNSDAKSLEDAVVSYWTFGKTSSPDDLYSFRVRRPDDFNLPRFIQSSWQMVTNEDAASFRMAEQALTFYYLADNKGKLLELARLCKVQPTFELGAPPSLKRAVEEIEKEVVDPEAWKKTSIMIGLALVGTALMLYLMANT